MLCRRCSKAELYQGEGLPQMLGYMKAVRKKERWAGRGVGDYIPASRSCGPLAIAISRVMD